MKLYPCPTCNSQISINANACPKCGETKLFTTKNCIVCGMMLHESMTTCSECGEPDPFNTKNLNSNIEQFNDNQYIPETNLQPDEYVNLNIQRNTQHQVNKSQNDQHLDSSKGIDKHFSEQQAQEVELDTIAIFIQENEDYYKKVFQYFSLPGSKEYYWNWSSFCFSPLWFTYRKMYVTGFIYTIFYCIPALWIIFPFIAGLTANHSLYTRYNRVLKNSQKNKRDEIKKYIESKGGVTIIGIFVHLLYMLFLGFIALFIHGAFQYSRYGM